MTKLWAVDKTWNMEHPGTSNNYDNYGKKCVKLNVGLAHVTNWSPGWSPELDLVQLLIKSRPSRTYKDIEENIEAQTVATASISTKGRSVRDCLPEGKMTWKKMMRPTG